VRRGPDLKPVVGVHLLDFELFESHPSALWHFEMRDRRDPSVRLGDEMSLYVVELRKADRGMKARAHDRVRQGAPQQPRDGPLDGGLDAWIAFLEHATEGKNMSDVTHPAVQRAMHKLQELSLNEEDRFRALARERALMTEMSMLSGARAEGREQGLDEGVRKGRQEGQTLAKTTTLTRLLTRRFGSPPDWALEQIARASTEQLDTWLDRILDAHSLQDVLG
jgi:predicted transposase/invertase (TIGR01784 family)